MRIDAQKQMEADLIAARNKAEESDRLKTAFLANMGHEIRTPLNAIVGFADLLPVVESEEDRNQLISEIQKNNYKLLNIIDGLVSMSKVEAEAKSLVKSQTNIVPVLQEIADYYRTMVDGSTVVLATQFPYPEILMNTDITKFKEIVNNLMQNAVKFTAQGSITLGFDLQQGDKLLLWVLDTGKGIAEEHQERIFERFFKVDEYVPGTGLGLSVAKSHVESLGGAIGVDSVLDNGSRFWVELPLS
jgi:signal transduction histidine kinase